ncbi:Armadillo-type fold domain containing protein [Pseudohyphozyma bogoriensis]|nr:Armadillo-type fold domain containing protein [Pseudohyphozyma bogoriensis]
MQGHDSVFQVVLPFLLDQSTQIRLQAANCILHCSSSTSSSVLKTRLNSTITTVTRTLSHLSSTSQFSSPTSQTLKLVSTCFRILTALFSRVSPLPPDVVSVSVAQLGTWSYHRAARASVGNVAPDRGRPLSTAGGGFGGVMGGFFPPGSPKKKSGRSLSRSSSRSSLAGSSESENDDGGESRHTSTQVRLDALTCLRSLAVNDPKALYPHWNYFLADSPYLRAGKSLLSLVESDPSLSVRVKAAQALEALLAHSKSYLAIAEDRPTKASFTSLSTRIGEIVAELHVKLAVLISSASTKIHADVLLAIFRVVQVLGDNAPYGRMKRPLAEPLCRAILPLLESEDAKVSLAACTSAASILDAVHSYPTTPQAFDFTDLAGAGVSLLSADASEELQSQSWSLLAVAAKRLDGFDLADALDHLRSHLSASTTLVQESQMLFISSVLQRASPANDIQPYSSTLTQILRVGLHSSRAPVRILACGALASPRLLELDLESGESPLHLVVEGIRLADDEDGAVRASACRALGLLVKSTFKLAADEFSAIVEVLSRRCSDSEPVKSSASWSLANCCDVLTTKFVILLINYGVGSLTGLSPSLTGTLNVGDLLRQALSLSSPENSEKAQTNGLRAIGCLLHFYQLSNDFSLLTCITERLSRSVQEGPVKLRWNAAAACANALTSSAILLPSSLPSSVPLILSLSSVLLDSPNFKVRIQAATGLAGLSNVALFGTRENVELVLARVGEARRKVDGEEEGAPAKEMIHLQQLRTKLDRCFSSLSEL